MPERTRADIGTERTIAGRYCTSSAFPTADVVDNQSTHTRRPNGWHKSSSSQRYARTITIISKPHAGRSATATHYRNVVPNNKNYETRPDGPIRKTSVNLPQCRARLPLPDYYHHHNHGPPYGVGRGRRHRLGRNRSHRRRTPTTSTTTVD